LTTAPLRWSGRQTAVDGLLEGDHLLLGHAAKSPTFLPGVSGIAQKLSPLGAWSGAEVRLRVREPAGGGRRALLESDVFVVTAVSHNAFVLSLRLPDQGILPDCAEKSNVLPERRATRLAHRLPWHVCTMTRTITPVLSLALVVVLMPPSPAAASEGEHSADRHIRTDDRRIQRLLDEGMLRSATLRALVERISHSDVVVYVRCDGDPRARIAGRMTFVSAAGGVRYVLVRLAPLRSRAHQIAILAHELQHVVEVADTPAIVDVESMAREYARMGHINHHSAMPGIAFDTQAAIDAGRRVLSELETMSGD
jgi:hypothetical protein